jgi:hypothetical protein
VATSVLPSAEGCRVQPDPGFVSDVEVLFVVVGSVQVISGTWLCCSGWAV